MQYLCIQFYNLLEKSLAWLFSNINSVRRWISEFLQVFKLCQRFDQEKPKAILCMYETRKSKSGASIGLYPLFASHLSTTHPWVYQARRCSVAYSRGSFHHTPPQLGQLLSQWADMILSLLRYSSVLDAIPPITDPCELVRVRNKA